MSKKKEIKVVWERIPPGRVGRWQYGKQHGQLGSVWLANGNWWASPFGEKEPKGGFASSEEAMKYVYKHVHGLPQEDNVKLP